MHEKNRILPIDQGRPVEPPKIDPTRLMEAFWETYMRSEIGQSVTDGEMIKKLRFAFFYGGFTSLKFVTQCLNANIAEAQMGRALQRLQAELDAVCRRDK